MAATQQIEEQKSLFEPKGRTMVTDTEAWLWTEMVIRDVTKEIIEPETRAKSFIEAFILWRQAAKHLSVLEIRMFQIN